MKIGDRIQTVIRDVAFGGDGVGRIGGLAIFVPFTVDGDEVEIEVSDLRKRYARGSLIRIVAPSQHRVEACCPYYTQCGGCRMQHIAYDHQMELKRRQVTEVFARIARIPLPSVQPVIPSPRPYGYRGKAEFHMTGGTGGPQRAGLMAPSSHHLVEVERCDIVDESINRKYREFREALREGTLRLPGDRQVIWSDEPGEVSAEGATEFRNVREVTRIVGEKRLTVPYGGFFQANVALIRGLVALVAEMSALSGRETVIDAYGGAGLFSCLLGSRAGRIFGIEEDREAVRCARINLHRSRLSQAQFFDGDMADILIREFVSCRVKVHVVVLDPPREGCSGDTLNALVRLRPERLVYVSCNPATQARDCRRLSESGYILRRLQPLDMFPQTAHIETVALLISDRAGEKSGA